MKGKKIVPQALGAMLVTVGAWAVNTVWALTIPAEVGAAAAGILAVFISILTPDSLESED